MGAGLSRLSLRGCVMLVMDALVLDYLTWPFRLFQSVSAYALHP
jgi:hypothetical protein